MADETLIDELMRRVQSLEDERKRWKWLALGAIFCLLLVVLGGGVVTFGVASAYWIAMQREEAVVEQLQQAQQRAAEQAMQAEVQAQQAEVARQQAIQALERAKDK
jgi:hypothetical protein